MILICKSLKYVTVVHNAGTRTVIGYEHINEESIKLRTVGWQWAEVTAHCCT